MQPFVASRLKVTRAERHINELDGEIQRYMKRKPFKIVIEQSSDPATHFWTVRIREPVPGEFSAIIGDVVHNLRAALDLLACDLVRLNKGSVKNVYFPFSETKADLD